MKNAKTQIGNADDILTFREIVKQYYIESCDLHILIAGYWLHPIRQGGNTYSRHTVEEALEALRQRMAEAEEAEGCLEEFADTVSTD